METARIANPQPQFSQENATAFDMLLRNERGELDALLKDVAAGKSAARISLQNLLTFVSGKNSARFAPLYQALVNSPELVARVLGNPNVAQIERIFERVPTLFKNPESGHEFFLSGVKEEPNVKSIERVATFAFLPLSLSLKLSAAYTVITASDAAATVKDKGLHELTDEDRFKFLKTTKYSAINDAKLLNSTIDLKIGGVTYLDKFPLSNIGDTNFTDRTLAVLDIDKRIIAPANSEIVCKINNKGVFFDANKAIELIVNGIRVNAA